MGKVACQGANLTDVKWGVEIDGNKGGTYIIAQKAHSDERDSHPEKLWYDSPSGKEIRTSLPETETIAP